VASPTASFVGIDPFGASASMCCLRSCRADGVIEQDFSEAALWRIAAG
jgi:hypothetical protein